MYNVGGGWRILLLQEVTPCWECPFSVSFATRWKGIVCERAGVEGKERTCSDTCWYENTGEFI